WMSSAGAKQITHNLLSRSMIFAIVASLNFPRCDSFGLRLLYGFLGYNMFCLHLVIRMIFPSYFFSFSDCILLIFEYAKMFTFSINRNDHYPLISVVMIFVNTRYFR